MAFSLIEEEEGAVPLLMVPKSGLESWRERAAPRERDWVMATGFTGEPGKLALVPDHNGGLGRVLVGVTEEETSMWALAGLSDALPPGDYRAEAVPNSGDATRLALGWALGTYRFDLYRDNKRETGARLVWPNGADRPLVERLAAAVCLARDLINTPASDLGPAELADAAVAVADSAGARHRVIVGDALIAENYPTIHAVGRASTRPPRLVDIRWGDKAAPKVTLVGKGVCFDSGGLDLKPASGMLNMKKDMGGAATALGLAHMIMARGLKLRLRVIIPAVENAISGTSFRPRDVYISRKGLSVEIGNTDAEGRLILADALALADDDKPSLIADFATLTGAARVALGPEIPPFFTDDDTLAGELMRAGATEADPVWRMPLWRPYDALLESKVADLNNVATGGHGGAITAALFLRRFVHTKSWVHFDIFAWTPVAKPGRPEGAECQTARALYALLCSRYS